MIRNIISFCVYKPWIALLFGVCVAIGGIYSFKELPIDAVPDITNIQVQVNTQVGNLPPEEIERAVTTPIEMILNGVPGVDQVRSITRYGLSQVTVVFKEGTDVFRARQLITERLATLEAALPPGSEPTLAPITTGLGEIYFYVVEADKILEGEARIAQLRELRTLQTWTIRPRLLTVPGVADVNTIGGYEKTITVSPKSKSLSNYGLHFSDLTEALQKVNRNVGGSVVEQTGEQFLIVGKGLFKNIDDIKKVPVKVLENFQVLTVDDVATVYESELPRTGAASSNGQESVLGTVMMLSGANSRTVSKDVDAKVKEIAAALPKGYKIDTVYNRSHLVDETLATIQENVVVGAFLVILVLFTLLGNIRAAFISAIVIPLSLLFSFIFMRVFDISGNLMSLGALDFGVITDGAVIVIDNCIRLINEKNKNGEKFNIKETIIDAALEIRKSAGFGELIVAISFIPIFSFVGIEGKMFKPMAATFIIAILGSVIFSFTVVPALASLLLKKGEKNSEPFVMKVIERMFSPVLNFFLNNAKTVVVGILIFLAGGVYTLRTLGGEFLPQLEEGSIALQFIRPVSTGVSASMDLDLVSQKVILETAEVSHVFARLGTAEIAFDPMGPNISDTYVMLKPHDQWPKVDGKIRSKEQVEQELIDKLQENIPGQRILASQPIQLRFNELLEGTRADISVKVFGESQESISATADAIAETLRKIPGAGDVEVESKGMQPILEVIPNQKVTSRLGISDQEILEAVEAGIGGLEVGTFYEGAKRFPLMVRLSKQERTQVEDISNIPVGILSNQTVPLSEVASVRFNETYASFSREQTKRRVAVLINPRGADTESFVEEGKKRVAKEVKLPQGTYLDWGGNFKNLQQAKERLMVMGPIALLVILLMVYASFGKLWQTILVFLSVPFALAGSIFTMKIANLPFTMSAGVGLIALSGISILNGVVLVSFFNELREKGLSGKDVILRGAMLRVRPVLMTAMTDVLGFLPMVLSTSPGAEVQRPVGLVIVSGVLCSTVLTLLVLPCIYYLIENFFTEKGVTA